MAELHLVSRMTLLACAAAAAACEDGTQAAPDPAPPVSAETARVEPPSPEPKSIPDEAAGATSASAAASAAPAPTTAQAAVEANDGKLVAAHVAERETAPKATAEPKAAEPEAPPTKGAAASETPFSTWLQTAGSYAAGKPAAVQAVLVAKDPFKCNDKYPYKFQLDPAPPGVSFASNVVRDMSVSPKRSTMSIPFTPSAAGKSTISGTLSFSVCTEEKCLVEKRKLSVAVDVK